MYDKNAPDHWREIRPGSTITLSDQQAIADSIEQGEGVRGRDYLVNTVWRIRQDESLVEWLLFKLDDDEQEIYIVVKIVDRDLNLFVYFEPNEFQPGNRRDTIERGDTWLFEEPDDVDDFRFDDLKFVREIVWTIEIEDNGGVQDKDVSYRMKGQGVLYGTCTHDPAQADLERMMAAIIEYSSESDYENPELMLLELGGERGEDGGLISLMIGCSINKSEVDVLKAQPDAVVVRKKPTMWEKILRKMSK